MKGGNKNNENGTNVRWRGEPLDWGAEVRRNEMWWLNRSKSTLWNHTIYRVWRRLCHYGRQRSQQWKNKERLNISEVTQGWVPSHQLHQKSETYSCGLTFQAEHSTRDKTLLALLHYYMGRLLMAKLGNFFSWYIKVTKWYYIAYDLCWVHNIQNANKP